MTSVLRGATTSMPLSGCCVGLLAGSWGLLGAGVWYWTGIKAAGWVAGISLVTCYGTCGGDSRPASSAPAPRVIRAIHRHDDVASGRCGSELDFRFDKIQAGRGDFIPFAVDR